MWSTSEHDAFCRLPWKRWQCAAGAISGGFGGLLPPSLGCCFWSPDLSPAVPNTRPWGRDRASDPHFSSPLRRLAGVATPGFAGKAASRWRGAGRQHSLLRLPFFFPKPLPCHRHVVNTGQDPSLAVAQWGGTRSSGISQGMERQRGGLGLGGAGGGHGPPHLPRLNAWGFAGDGAVGNCLKCGEL